MHERDGPARHSTRASDPFPLRAQMGEAEARSSPALVDEGGVFDGIENGVQGVFDRHNETGRQLLAVPACVHKRRRVRQKLEPSHRLEKHFLRPLRCLNTIERDVGLCDLAGHTPEHLVRRLDNRARVILSQVARLKNGSGVLSQRS